MWPDGVSIGGSRYFLTFIDDNSRKMFVYFLKSKQQTRGVFSRFQVDGGKPDRQTDQAHAAMCHTCGTEYVNGQFEKFLRRSGIHHEVTVPYNPEQNGLAERANRTIVKRARCLLFDANMEKRFCDQLITDEMTPEERFTGVRPDLAELRVFGAKVVCHVPKAKRSKWDPKSEPGVGYSDRSKGLRIFNPRSGKVFVSRDVVFLTDGSGNTKQRSEVEPANEMMMELLNNEIVGGSEVTGSPAVFAELNGRGRF